MRTANLASGFMAAVLVVALVDGLRLTGGAAQTGAPPPASQAGSQRGQSGGEQAGGRGNAARGGSNEPLMSPGPSAARFPHNAEEFDQLFNQVKNWGRWGPDDQFGAANLITDGKRKHALAAAKLGIAVGLAHPPLIETAPDNPSPFEHTMNRGFTTDTYRVSYHGMAHSHIDALCHILYKGQTYNGHATADVNTEKGCSTLGASSVCPSATCVADGTQIRGRDMSVRGRRRSSTRPRAETSHESGPRRSTPSVR